MSDKSLCKYLGNIITEMEGTAEILANFQSIWGCVCSLNQKTRWFSRSISADLLLLTGVHAEKRSQTEKLDGTMVCTKTQYYFLLCK